MYEDISHSIKESLRKSKIFEKRVRTFLSKERGINFDEQTINIKGLNKKFDLVSEDKTIIGDVKFFKNVQTPAAKYSTIAEYVWLLENTEAKEKFLIFGRDKEVPIRWLKRFGSLLNDVKFYFFDGLILTKLN